MIHNLIINENDFSSINKLNDIDFTKDIVISCPYKTPQIYLNNKFDIKNHQSLKIEKRTFTFVSHFKMSYPDTIYVQYTSAIIGMEIFHIVKNESKVLFENVLINYTTKNPVFVIREKDRELLNVNNKFHGMLIKPNTKIINLNFLHTFQSNNQITNIYLIYNNLIFQQFPSLG